MIFSRKGVEKLRQSREEHERLQKAINETAFDDIELDEAELRREERWKWWGDQRDDLLRLVGYPTRIVVYLLLFGAFFAAAYALSPSDIRDRPLGSLTLRELAGPLFGAIFFGWVFLLLLKGFFAEEGPVDWEAWGKVGVVLIAIVGVRLADVLARLAIKML
jgi:hypothetical protein